jgi:hypothetical protein
MPPPLDLEILAGCIDSGMNIILVKIQWSIGYLKDLKMNLTQNSRVIHT